MGVASLVLGILSLLASFIPFFNYLVFIPAVVGLILGIVEIVVKSKAKQSKGMGIAGTILSSIAILFIVFWTFIIGIVAIAAEDEYGDYDYESRYEDDFDKFEDEIEDSIKSNDILNKLMSL